MAARQPKPNGLAARARALVDGEIQHAIREDGGDIAFERLDGHTVHVRMGGVCCVCPSGPRTVKLFVERRLREDVDPRLVVEARFVKPYYMK
ncbi:NifU family protein [bacterium]|nr:NifU family protein [bacterium]